MKQLFEMIYWVTRAVRKQVRDVLYRRSPDTQIKIDRANQQVRELIEMDGPCMVARFGYVELEVLCTYLIQNEPNVFRKLRIFWRGGRLNWDSQLCQEFVNIAGFFPGTPDFMQRFARQVIEEIPLVDLLHSWRPGEKSVMQFFASHAMFSANYHPYLSNNPWMPALEGKRVLVVSPFARTIESQYKHKRKKIFNNTTMLPEFELKTIKAVQSYAGVGSGCGFDSWFDALEHMKQEIDGVDFDVAIIGAGAYGFSLCAHVKRMGKKAIHTAGGTQLLFGIKGRRWDSNPTISALYNEHWVRPDKDERPENASIVESGCYW